MSDSSSANDAFREYLRYDLVPEVRQDLAAEVERDLLPAFSEVVNRVLNIARRRTENRYNQIHRSRNSIRDSHAQDSPIAPQRTQHGQARQTAFMNGPRLEASATPHPNRDVLPVVAEESSPDAVEHNNFNQTQNPETALESQAPLDDFMGALEIFLAPNAWEMDGSGSNGQPSELHLQHNAAPFSPLEPTTDLQNPNITIQDARFDGINNIDIGDWQLDTALQPWSDNFEIDNMGTEVNTTLSAMNAIPTFCQEHSNSKSTLIRPPVAGLSRRSPLDKA
jgi:hypothetical protein